ncbi:hypothetical protein M1M07_00960 [Rhodococcus sp. HM1]|uniref:hypothetical protein n=1 Tax=unclassified Rhodococcus (in: high G+C Gram-positive bacteria) TaxID=192944 RepID=UPI0018CDEEF6|nr:MULTISPECIES: hypothetical protein [unclassified Rhodococcus (in: high G+C Gram-positive bacteria)]MBH0118318.1 hypothetical protein [Rhodococcus sp. CX]MCK8669687.1 hypothetical protein [Rhodococcus sp. HM1]
MSVDRSADPLRLAAGAATVLAGAVGSAMGVSMDLARRLPGVASAIDGLEARGDAALRAADAAVDRVLRVVVRKVVQAALLEVDITAVVRDHVDLDAIAEGIDVGRIVDRVDIDGIAERIDIDRILDRVDIDGVAARVDVEKIIARVDIDGIAARLDLTPILDRVDIDAIAARVDVDAIIRRVDLIGLAGTVIEGVDLPEIIRESTGTMSTEAVQGVRTQGMRADDAVSGFVGRMFGRHPEHHEHEGQG